MEGQSVPGQNLAVPAYWLASHRAYVYRDSRIQVAYIGCVTGGHPSVWSVTVAR
ncbi:hypothetical protein NFA_28790 [Nocardia farcinica IFM 10152]|uniref:Uncharacterized protein n=1 Tax=Nocardia farcinica (strain IFM 10152) TaxID=247156 RepID=Q5YVR5_NOCFA|nr:hypothetical protein NFA_28790 [Nocardia farcinica IFM 10152]